MGHMSLPVADGKHLQEDLVGSHSENYDFVVNLAHFKGHAMAGFGGVIKNMAIGIASSAGKSPNHNPGNCKWFCCRYTPKRLLNHWQKLPKP